MSDINRYDITSNSHIEDLDIDENKSGRWVDFKDHRDRMHDKDQLIKSLERQLDEAIKIAENAIKNWGDTAYSYGSYSDDIDTEEIKLKQLKEKGE